MSKEKVEGGKALISINSPAYRKFLAANCVLEMSREATGYIDPEALEIYRRAVLGVSREAKEALEAQEALLGKKPSTSR
ncbi:hypothetical protein HY502_04050 [Candidatus Woesebacteria bacterium]|nr:hypothetical protein [Candidatus Woesebacteria bacterium]